ncbi:MAG TPA: DUF6666 family protein [Pirellulales bacterium]|nr:DUF6666 family protein [Pirellulales bacterium]
MKHALFGCALMQTFMALLGANATWAQAPSPPGNPDSQKYPVSLASYDQGPPTIPREGPQAPIMAESLSETPPAEPGAELAPHCTTCDDGSCVSCRDLRPDCQDCPRFGFLAFSGADTFRNIADGAFQSNFGSVSGLNAAVPLPRFEALGLGWQLGASYGVYDLSGRSSSTSHPSGVQQQIFITTGFFHRGNDGQRFSYGLVYDWMINNNYGASAVPPTLGQWRGQAEWAFSSFNSLGIWATVRDKGFNRQAPENALQISPLSQLDFFWHHKYAQGADSWFYLGLPTQKKLGGPGTLGEFIMGGSAQVPISPQLAMYANAMYMWPSASSGAVAATQDAYNVGFGLAWYPGLNARTRTVNGGCWLPYLPLANNGNFLVDMAGPY